jgi:arylsulfatase A-like enzyme
VLGGAVTKRFQGKIALDIRDSVPDWGPYVAPRAPQGTPNVLVIAWDDVGYGAMDVFGGPIETPTMNRIAELGVRLSNFHTTALCSPTRSSLLNGRNATSNGMATIAEFSSGFPGISTRIPFENGFISEVLAGIGFNTYCVGKWHLTPGEEANMAAFKGRWPLGRGFERFYGYLGGESNSWFPDPIYDNHQIDPPGRPEEGYHPSRDLCDRAIQFIGDAKVVDPDKPFFLYLAPQAGHAPHQHRRDQRVRCRELHRTRRPVGQSHIGRLDEPCPHVWPGPREPDFHRLLGLRGWPDRRGITRRAPCVRPPWSGRRPIRVRRRARRPIQVYQEGS